MLGIHYSPDAGAYPYGTLVTPNTTYVYPIATDEDLLWMAADALALGAASGLPAELPLGPAACRQFRRAAAAVTGREVSELCRAEDAVLAAEHPDGPGSPPPVLTPREPQPSGATAAATDSAAEGRGECCVCMAARATQGFVHESAIHVCVCEACEEDLRARGQLACPVCRQPFSSVKMAVST
ncbi:hypothetical protein HYH03_003456 [Edaphochlamys debaryana]|uniref:RING-type domain-containing protein n=1 Tax=Edaphochlamys debaryana TaxID=47281 RepID=A0A836C344_9CHLO|nr:hypothetical protein HYH03_003456 [Edaphochlamys debaryana]|eukprot:KAG2498716.1 hypothetical protein HYH03_003456 [Edaphochlamys debaryana]